MASNSIEEVNPVLLEIFKEHGDGWWALGVDMGPSIPYAPAALAMVRNLMESPAEVAKDWAKWRNTGVLDTPTS